MNNKKLVMSIIAGILLIAGGIVFLTDGLTDGANIMLGHWYLFLVAFIACMCIAYAVVARAALYVLFAVFFGGVLIMLTIPATSENITHAMTWPIIPMFLGFGIIITYFVSKKQIGYIKTGIFITLISAVLLIAAVTDQWLYCLPAVLIISGIYAIVLCAVKVKKDTRTKEKQVIYVTPSQEEDKNEKSDAAD